MMEIVTSTVTIPVTISIIEGDSNWDSNGGSNYTFTPGSYIINSGAVVEGTLEDIDTLFSSTENKSATVYYYADSAWSTAYIHYGINNSWTTAPGVEMTLVDEDTNLYMTEINLGTASVFTACFNDGGNTWDSNGGSNYSLTATTSTIQDGVITTN